MEQIIEDILLGHDERRPEVTLNKRVAAALQAARETGIEEAALWHDKKADEAAYYRRLALGSGTEDRHKEHARQHRYAAEQLRALATKPGSKP